MMTGPLLTAVAMLISCTFLDKSLYIVTVFLSNVLFGLGLGCYATPSTDTAVVNAPENKVGVASGIYKMGSSLGGAMGIAVTASLFALFLPLGMASARSMRCGLTRRCAWGNGGQRPDAAASVSQLIFEQRPQLVVG
jgi:DHA2 family multidrug resistance protein-like MFS transporter